jgi:hypothetical protein
MPFPVGAVFPVDNRISNSEIDRQIRQFDRERPEFESAGGDGPSWELGESYWARIQQTMKVGRVLI